MVFRETVREIYGIIDIGNRAQSTIYMFRGKPKGLEGPEVSFRVSEVPIIEEETLYCLAVEGYGALISV